MSLSRLALEIDAPGDGQVGLIWSTHTSENDFYPVGYYVVPESRLKQASDDVAKLVSRLIAGEARRSDRARQALISALREQGVALFRSLLPPSDGQASAAIIKLMQTKCTGKLLTSGFGAKTVPLQVPLHVRLCKRLHIPWGLVCHPDTLSTPLSAAPATTDLRGFWIQTHKLAVLHQSGSASDGLLKAGSAFAVAEAVQLSGCAEFQRWFRLGCGLIEAIA